MTINVLEDYLDADVSYLLGLLVARGTISNNQGIRQLSIEFPFSSLKAKGISGSLTSLLKTYNRLDILEYDFPRGRQPLSITLAGWNETTQNLDRTSIITNNYGQI
jgi:hypothetical protein